MSIKNTRTHLVLLEPEDEGTMIIKNTRTHLVLLEPEDEGTMIIKNTGIYSSILNLYIPLFSRELN